MDRNSSDQVIIGMRVTGCKLRVTLLGWGLLFFMVLFLLTTKRAAVAASLDSFELSDANREMINMEEMKIQGDINKPNIMYVIPRSDLKIQMKLHDEYFLPASAVPNDVVTQPDKSNNNMVTQAAESNIVSSLNGEFPLKEPLPYSFSLKSKSLFYINKPEIKEGSCVVCHYPEMAIPKSVSAPLLLKELNQSCLHCHPSRYYHICWKEAEKGISQPPGQGKGNCKKCHALWMQQQDIEQQDTGTQETRTKGAKSPWHWNQPHEIQSKEKEMPGKGLSKQGYDIDAFCTTCHKY